MKPSNLEQAREIHDAVLEKMNSLKKERRSGVYVSAGYARPLTADGRTTPLAPIKLMIKFDASSKQVLSWRFEATMKHGDKETAFAQWDGKYFQVSKNFSTICNVPSRKPYLLKKAIGLLQHLSFAGKA